LSVVCLSIALLWFGVFLPSFFVLKQTLIMVIANGWCGYFLVPLFLSWVVRGSWLENRDHAACKQRKIAMWREMGQATNHCQ
jgi:predicted membrane metal-binding protein